jgi:hypothetical protein
MHPAKEERFEVLADQPSFPAQPKMADGRSG